MTIKSSDIQKTIELLEKVNTYANEQFLNSAYNRNFYRKLQHDSFELYIGLKRELELRDL